MSIANKDGAMKRKDPTTFKNLRKEFVTTSGVGILTIVEELVTIHEEPIHDINEEISKIERCVQD